MSSQRKDFTLTIAIDKARAAETVNREVKNLPTDAEVGLKPGRIIRVNRVKFLPGHLGLTRFIKYPGLTRVGSRVILMESEGESCRARSHTLKVYLYKIQILLFSDHSLGIGINAAQKCCTSCPVGSTPTLCVRSRIHTNIAVFG